MPLSAQGALSAEATRLCANRFEASWLRRGDTWVTAHTVGGSGGGFTQPLGAPQRQTIFVEAHTVTSRLHERGLSQADTLNGIRWQGGVNFFAKALRIHRDGQWGAWRNGGVVFQCFLTHKHNQWSVSAVDPVIASGQQFRPDPGQMPGEAPLQRQSPEARPQDRCRPCERWNEQQRRCVQWRACY
ncbi:MAG: hypothetical protein F9K29_03140 [Hyphomicrobiaceae bacterium]|nr:MAG: hypothetical protein F9K29_03140 [Hyphomicrobiaceae bacterium]